MSRANIRRIASYPTGTILAASVLVSMALMYIGTTIPTLSARFENMFSNPLRTLLGMNDVLMGLAHIGMLSCGIALVFRSTRCIPWALGLVGLIWLGHVALQIAFREFDLILPTTLFALFSGLPLLLVLSSLKKPRPDPEAGGRSREWLLIGEGTAALLILGMATSIAVIFPLTVLLDKRSPAEKPAGQDGPASHVHLAFIDPERDASRHVGCRHDRIHTDVARIARKPRPQGRPSGH